jgi:hypothetical protein
MNNGHLIYGENLRISSYIRKSFLIYDFAPDPTWISLCMMESFVFFFISVGGGGDKT